MSPSLLSAIAAFSSALASGQFAGDCRAFVCSARRFALGKDNKKIRPIAVGDVLRRLTGKVLLKKYENAAREILAPEQIGIALPGATESFIHAVRAWARSRSNGEALLKIDFKNAFNSLSRKFMLLAVKEFMPDLLPFSMFFYADHTTLRYQQHEISSQ